MIVCLCQNGSGHRCINHLLTIHHHPTLYTNNQHTPLKTPAIYSCVRAQFGNVLVELNRQSNHDFNPFKWYLSISPPPPHATHASSTAEFVSAHPPSDPAQMVECAQLNGVVRIPHPPPNASPDRDALPATVAHHARARI